MVPLCPSVVKMGRLANRYTRESLKRGVIICVVYYMLYLYYCGTCITVVLVKPAWSLMLRVGDSHKPPK